MSDWHHLIPFARAHQRGLALATLIRVEGSSYRPVGSRLLIAGDGSFSGMLSGGCLEEGIAALASDVTRSGQPRMIEIDTRPHFGCAGILYVLLEPLSQTLIQDITLKIEGRQTFLLTTSLIHGTTLGEQPGLDCHLEVVKPNKRLIAIGATDDMEPLLKISSVLGWELHRVVRDERLLEDMQPIAGETLSLCPPLDFQSIYPPDEQTAVVVMSHHLATDFSYLKQIFNQPYGYIGLLGSRRRRETLLAELGECSMLEDTPYLDRFHAPAGLALGNDHPSEIALSIITQIQLEFRRLDSADEEPNVIQLPSALSA